MDSHIFKICFGITFIPLLLISCSQKINTNFDLSNLPKPKIKKTSEKEINKSAAILDKPYISDLIPLKDREQILSKFKYGKKDPFSESQIQLNKFSLDLKITGFLNTELKKYVFVNYLGKKGTISEESIGGINTNLLPEGAKVINIDTNNLELKINYANENFIFEQ